MDFELNADQKAIVDSLTTLLTRHAGAKRAIELERTGEYDHALHAALHEAGFLDIYDAGALEAVLVIEQVARAAGVVSIGASALVLPALGCSSEHPAALSDGDVHAPLRFLGDARELLVLGPAQTERLALDPHDVERVPSAFMFPLGRLKRECAPQRTPLDHEPARARALWRLALAAECVGAMQGALSLTVEYVKNRRQFGRAIGSFQALQHRLALAAVQLEGSRYLTYEAAHRGTSEAIAVAAAYASRAAQLVHTETHQLTGALGFTREHDLHVWSMRLCALRLELSGTSGHRRALAQERWNLAP